MAWALGGIIVEQPAAAQMGMPGTAPARGPDTPAPVPATDPEANAPIVPDAQFDAALPPITDDINAPLEPATVPPAAPAGNAEQAAAAPLTPGQLPAPAVPDTALTAPLEPLAAFDSTPLNAVADSGGRETPDIAYVTEVRGLDPLGLTDEFNSLSALREGKGKADNATQIAARAREDEGLAVRLMKSFWPSTG